MKRKSKDLGSATKLRHRAAALLHDDRGAALFEYALTIVVFFGLLFFIIRFGWWWWTQAITATALHDGLRSRAARHGNVAGAWQTAYDLMHAGLGRANADRHAGSMSFWADSGRRSVQGRMSSTQRLDTPFIGSGSGGVEAGSFQRDWQFYGGRPDFWE